MRKYAISLTLGCFALTAPTPVVAQTGHMMGQQRGASDSTRAAIMQGVHQLLEHHDKLQRVVTNLPNGVRTVTTSRDPDVLLILRRHVGATAGFVAEGTDPGLPMSSPALRGVLKNGKRISRVTSDTAGGIIVVETSEDPATVALLQQHAKDITEMVTRGMAAAHEAMMRPAPEPPAAEPAHAHVPGMTHGAEPAHPDGAAAPPRPVRAGQEAFGTIGEVVRLLDANPSTDWASVDIEALRQHLIDMDDVTMRAIVRTDTMAGGATFHVSGTGRVRAAIQRMALSHGATVVPADGFSWSAVKTATGARVTIRALDAGNARMVARIRALGFVGLLTLGDHHQPHHLGIADGSMRGAHQHH